MAMQQCEYKWDCCRTDTSWRQQCNSWYNDNSV